MPAARAASSREAPSRTRAKASIRREAAVSRHRLASRRSSPAPSSFRVIATVMAPPPIGHTADQPRQAPRGSARDDASAIRAVGIIHGFIHRRNHGTAGRAMPKRVFKRTEVVEGEPTELTVAREVACAGRFVGRLDLERAYVALRGDGEMGGSYRCLVAYLLLAYAWGMGTMRSQDDRAWARVPARLLGEWGIDR